MYFMFIEEGTERKQTKRKKVMSDVDKTSDEHLTDVALRESEVLSDKKKSPEKIAKSKLQQGNYFKNELTSILQKIKFNLTLFKNYHIDEYEQFILSHKPLYEVF